MTCGSLRARMMDLWRKFLAHGRLLDVLLLALVLAPVVGGGLLVWHFSIDQRFLDDWVWAMDLLKVAKGTFTLHDLFAVHLEHRPALAKGLALGVTWLAKGNVAAQCALGFVWYVGSFFFLVRLCLVQGGARLREAWVLLLLCGAILFTPVQWQDMLWPICCETVMPMFFLLLACLWATGSGSWWVKGLVLAACGAAAMLSFASGMLVWLLPIPVALWCGNLESNRERGMFLGVLAVILGAFLAWYFYDFHNEVPPQYAYGHGAENTMKGEVAEFMQNPWVDAQFVATFCGALFVRGWAMDTKTAAMTAGWALLAALLAAVVYLLWHWRDRALRARVMPLLCLAFYTPMTGSMVAVGRVYAGGPGVALNTRYHVHQIQLLLGLLGAAFFIFRHIGPRLAEPARRGWAAVGWVCLGMVGGVIGVGWVYGSSMMAQWQWARARDAAAQRLCLVFPAFNKYVAHVSGKFSDTVNITRELDARGLIHPRPIVDRRLSNFRINSSPLKRGHGQFERLYKTPEQGWRAEGFTSLPRSFRPPDAILFVYRMPDQKEWTIFGFTQVVGVPSFLGDSMAKDLWAIRTGDPWPDSVISGWDHDVAMAEEPPAGALVTAWALDALNWEVTRINRHFGKSAQNDDQGETLESAATLIRQED